MNETIENGSRKKVDGVIHVFYEGYWIKCYEPPRDSLSAKKSPAPFGTGHFFAYFSFILETWGGA